MKSKLLLIALSGATLLAGGCAIVPVNEPHHSALVVRIAPPPLRYEYIGPPPVVGHIWIGGYWNWVDVRYVWVPGYWVAPRPGYYWVPHRWERHGDHWHPRGGRWDRGHGPRFEHRAKPPRMERNGRDRDDRRGRDRDRDWDDW